MLIIPPTIFNGTASQVRINTMRAKVDAYLSAQKERDEYYRKYGREKPIEVIVYDAKPIKKPIDKSKLFGILTFILSTVCLTSFLIYLFS